MNYSGLYITESIFLSIVALWFARQLKCFKLFNDVNDPRGILPPTVFLFVGLPTIAYLYQSVSQNSSIWEIFKFSTPLISISTFFLGQYTAKREKQKEKEEQEKKAAKRILYLLQDFINSDTMSKIKQSLNISCPDYKLENYAKTCEEEREYFSSKIKEIEADQSIFNSSYRETVILYFKRVESFFKDKNQARNDYTVTVWLFYSHKYQAYEHKLHLCKNIIKDNSLVQSNLSSLEFDKKRLMMLKERKENIFNQYKCLSSMPIYTQEYEKIKCLIGRYPYLLHQIYDESIEETLIAFIDKILDNYK